MVCELETDSTNRMGAQQRWQLELGGGGGGRQRHEQHPGQHAGNRKIHHPNENYRYRGQDMGYDGYSSKGYDKNSYGYFCVAIFTIHSQLLAFIR